MSKPTNIVTLLFTFLLHTSVVYADEMKLICSGKYQDWESKVFDAELSGALVFVGTKEVTVQNALHFNGIFKLVDAGEANIIFSDGDFDGYSGSLNRFNGNFSFMKTKQNRTSLSYLFSGSCLPAKKLF